ncbi:MAG: DNA replication/repair protein RecF [Gammaproteobacteria bacterium]
MSLSRIVLRDFRNLVHAEIEPAPGLNIFVGANGAGKTSFLEALVCMARGRPLRSGRGSSIVRDGTDKAHVFVEVTTDYSKHRLGFERSRHGVQLRCDGEAVSSFLSLGRHLPVRFFGPDSQLLVDGGPELRRGFLDWGLFHVEHESLAVMTRYRRTLKQRNKMLYEKTANLDGDPFVEDLGRTGDRWTELRSAHVHGLEQMLRIEPDALSKHGKIDLLFRKGYPDNSPLETVLRRQSADDQEKGFTTVGAHRADLDVRVAGSGLKGRISRGQQKMTTYRLLRSQAAYLAKKTGKEPILLVDDLGSELDPISSQSILNDLCVLGWQVFVTVLPGAITPEQQPTARWFHVEQASIKPVL